MIKPLAPCMDCSDRNIGCHGICDRYKAYTEAHEALKENIRKQEFVHNYIKDMHKEQYERYKRNRTKKIRSVIENEQKQRRTGKT